MKIERRKAIGGTDVLVSGDFRNYSVCIGFGWLNATERTQFKIRWIPKIDSTNIPPVREYDVTWLHGTLYGTFEKLD